MKAIIKLSINLGLSIAEARIHHNRLFSQVAQGPVRSTPTATPQPVIPSEISLQIRKIQDELKELRENTITDINNSMVTLSQDLDDTKARLNSIDARFDKLEKTQELHSTAAAATAASQSMRFDKLDAILSKLVTAILGPTTEPSQILHSDVNLQSGAQIHSPPQSRSSFNLMSPIIEDSHPNRDESNFMDEY
jgi:TolA-binding protein